MKLEQGIIGLAIAAAGALATDKLTPDAVEADIKPDQ